MEPSEFRNPYAAPDAAMDLPPPRSSYSRREPDKAGRIARLIANPGLANALWIFGEEKRCLHDHFADTIVVTA